MTKKRCGYSYNMFRAHFMSRSSPLLWINSRGILCKYISSWFLIIFDSFPASKTMIWPVAWGLQPKELNKVIAVLANDSLVKMCVIFSVEICLLTSFSYRQNELKEGAQRSVGKQYYYIDYEHFCNVVKWRIAKMRYIIDSTTAQCASFSFFAETPLTGAQELDNKGLHLPAVQEESYSPLEVDNVMDFAQGLLLCEICPCRGH